VDDGMLTGTDILTIERTLQLAIAPAFVLGGVMAVLNLLIGRLQRLVDLEIALRDQGLEERRLRPILIRRSRIIYPAITCCIISGLLLCVLVIVSFLEPLFGITAGLHVAGLLIGGMAFLALALIMFLWQILLSAQDHGRLRLEPRC